MNATNYIRVGTEVCFFKGKGGKPVAYSDTGKVILCKNKIRTGYARLKTVEERDRCFLVNADHIVKDMYSGIDYDDFIKALPLHGYNIGFDYMYKNTFNESMESHIYAYNLKTGVVIVAETLKPRANESTNFDTLYMYLPNVPCNPFIKTPNFSHGSSDMVVFDFSCSWRKVDILSYIDSIMQNYSASNIWPKEASLSLRNFEEESGGNNHLDRLLAAPEALCLFKNCNFLKEIMTGEEIKAL